MRKQVKYNPHDVEEDILAFWKKNNIYEKAKEKKIKERKI